MSVNKKLSCLSIGLFLMLFICSSAFAQTTVVFTYQGKLNEGGSLANGQSAVAQAPTAFTYQGKLNDGAAPANGLYDFTLSLYDATQNLLGSGSGSAQVTGGIFTIGLDGAGALFTSDTAFSRDRNSTARQHRPVHDTYAASADNFVTLFPPHFVGDFC